MQIFITDTDLKRIYATNVGGTNDLDMRRIQFEREDGTLLLTLWLSDKQAAILHHELERLWQVEKPAHEEVVNQWADAHASELNAGGAMSPTGKMIFDIANETNRSLAQALGINAV